MLDQLTHRRRDHGARQPCPRPVRTAETSGAHLLFDDALQEAHIAARQAPQPALAGWIHRSVEYRFEQGQTIGVAQRLQVKSNRPAAPQRRDGTGNGRAVADRQDQARQSAVDELLQHERRCVVEQMSVVDHDYA